MHSFSCPEKQEFSCHLECTLSALSPSEGMAGMASAMFGFMMQVVMFGMMFMSIFAMSLFIFAFVVVYYVMKYEVLPRKYEELKTHVI